MFPRLRVKETFVAETFFCFREAKNVSVFFFRNILFPQRFLDCEGLKKSAYYWKWQVLVKNHLLGKTQEKLYWEAGVQRLIRILHCQSSVGLATSHVYWLHIVKTVPKIPSLIDINVTLATQPCHPAFTYLPFSLLLLFFFSIIKRPYVLRRPHVSVFEKTWVESVFLEKKKTSFLLLISNTNASCTDWNHVITLHNCCRIGLLPGRVSRYSY